MAFNRYISLPHNFVYSRCTGIIDDNDLRVHVLSFQVETKRLKLVRELLDFRHLQKAARLTLQGVIEISELERQRSEDRDFRLAIVAPLPLFYQMALTYAQIIQTENLKATVFKNEDLAMALAWLGYRGREKEQLTTFIGRRANQGK